MKGRIRVSCAQLSDVTGKMTPYLKETALSYLILKDKDTNWITLSKDVYNPGEHIEGRYNRVLKDGSCILALYRKGASDFLGFRYARICSTVGWAAPDVPGEYELRLLQKINEDKKIRYVNLATAGLTVNAQRP